MLIRAGWLLAGGLLAAGGAYGAWMEIRPGVRGIWQAPGEGAPAAGPWRAQWIWMPEDAGSDAMLARGTVDLPAVPQEARLRITATSQYELFVNGESVCRGPARSRPHHQSYDILEVSGLLRAGRNTLAIRVHVQAGQVSYHEPVRGGLLAQLDAVAGGETVTMATGPRWKVSPDEAWDKRAPRMSRFHLQVNDRVDLRRQARGWTGPAFDDRAWRPARVLRRETGWPTPQADDRPQALTFPWTALVARDIPYLEEKDIRAVVLIGASTVRVKALGGGADEGMAAPVEGAIEVRRGIDAGLAGQLPPYQKAGGALTLPAPAEGEAWFLLFDFGMVRNGWPQLDVEGPAGSVVDVLCAPYMLEGRFTADIVASQLSDRIVLSGGRDTWRATYFKPARYLGLVVRAQGGPVRIHSAGVRRVSYPFLQTGSLAVPDAPWVREFWQASAQTIRTATTDAYTDNYRERRQYAQTGYYAAMGNYPVFGDLALQRRYLVQVAEEQQANGMMPAYAPPEGDDSMVILDSNCLWIRSLHNYLLYSGDRGTARELLPAARKLLQLLHGYTNAAGLLDNPPYPYWLDHALLDRRGASFPLNGHYLGALEDFAQVLEWLGEADAGRYRARAGRLREALRTQFWDPERKLFADAVVDGERSTMFSEHANALALALDVGTREQAAAIAGQLLERDGHDFVRRKSGVVMVTPAMSYFLHAGLCRHGYVKESLEMFRERFAPMLRAGGNGTLWEEWWLDKTGRSGAVKKTVTRSDAQMESAFPPMLFTEYVLGVRPTQPGMAEVDLFRSRAGFREVQGAIPTRRGMLRVRWTFAESGGGELELTVPVGTTVRLDAASLGAREGVRVDGRRWEGAGAVSLEEGAHRVRF